MAQDTHGLSIGFDLSRNRRRDELITNKNMKGKHHPRFLLKAVFGSAVHEDIATYGFG